MTFRRGLIHIIRYSPWILDRLTLFVMGLDSIQFNSLWALDRLNWINHTAAIHSPEGDLKQMQNFSGWTNICNVHGCNLLSSNRELKFIF